MTKARFQCAVYLDPEDTAFLLFAQARGLGKSRADVIRKLITARRAQYQAGLNTWLISPEGRNLLRVEGLEGLVGPNLNPTVVGEVEIVDPVPEAANNTGVASDSVV